MLLGISRQVYYRSKRSINLGQERAGKVIHLVNEIRIKMPKIGTRKLYHILQEDLKELSVGRDKLFQILKANRMLIKPSRSYHITTNSHHRFRKHKNIIEKLNIERPEQVWVSDITYIGNRQNPIYLALVTDAYSKKIVGYDVSASLDASGCVRALKSAIKSRNYMDSNLIHHSDRGLQYCSNEYQKILNENNIKTSMTESYDPYANAIAERVNGILKSEFLDCYGYKLSLKLMKKVVQESINIYNQDRPHYSCYMKTPNQMHNQNEIKIRTYKSKNPQEAYASCGFN
jgi:transposase InsO family protein